LDVTENATTPAWVKESLSAVRRAPSFEVGNQVLTLSHRKLLSSKAMVVNVAETPGQDSGRQG